MAKPLVTFPSDERAMIDAYEAAFAPRSEPYKPATVTSAFPTAALTGTTTHLQVEHEGANVEDFPVTERGQVRVTAYAPPGKRSTVQDLASLALGLATRFATSDIHGVTPLVGRSDVITDPTTKNLMVWFTVRVDLKATQLAS